MSLPTTAYQISFGGHTYAFRSLNDLMAKATPLRSGDILSNAAARNSQERAAAQWLLADVPLKDFLEKPALPYELDNVTRIILDDFNFEAFQPIASLTVGEFREWLLAQSYDDRTAPALAAIAPGLTPEMSAAVSKLMSNSELIAVASAISNTSAFRTTIGLPGTLATRLQPNHPTDDPMGIAASIADGLLLGAGDAVIGINPATDFPTRVDSLLHLIDDVRQRYEVPTQSCVLTHVTTTLDLLEKESPVDLVFQSIAGTEGTNSSFGVTPELLSQAYEGALSLNRGTVGNNCMYFETGQGSALSAGAHLDADGYPVDQQTLEARAYGLARHYNPLLVNTVVGFIGPEYLYNGKQIIRAGLEDNFCGKLLGLPMGVDVCYTNHAEADSDDSEALLYLLIEAGTAFVISVPGSDDIMLGYQSLSYNDIALARKVTGRRHTPEFENWLEAQQIVDPATHALTNKPQLDLTDLLALGGNNSND